MAVPKKKTSKAKKNMRRSHHAIITDVSNPPEYAKTILLYFFFIKLYLQHVIIWLIDLSSIIHYILYLCKYFCNVFIFIHYIPLFYGFYTFIDWFYG